MTSVGDFFGLGGNEVYQKYFRTGVYTHLCLQPVRILESGARELKWNYWFADFGLHFNLKKHFIIWGDETVLDVETGKITKARDVEDLRNVLFDHYHAYVKEIYAMWGIQRPSPLPLVQAS
jgi:hypothetical protein